MHPSLTFQLWDSIKKVLKYENDSQKGYFAWGFQRFYLHEQYINIKEFFKQLKSEQQLSNFLKYPTQT